MNESNKHFFHKLFQIEMKSVIIPMGVYFRTAETSDTEKPDHVTRGFQMDRVHLKAV